MIEEVGLFLAGLIGGMVNSIAGGGSFITFPALMAAGVSPICLLYTSPSPRDRQKSRMPSSA